MDLPSNVSAGGMDDVCGAAGGQNPPHGRPSIRADLSRYSPRQKTDANNRASSPKTAASKTVSALSSHAKKASNKASNKSRAKLSRHRKIMEAQIPKSRQETAVNVFVGDISHGVWRDAIQVTEMGEVYRVGTKNGENTKYRKKFRGAIVRFGETKDRNYDAVPESNFRVKVPCYAKQCGKETAENLIPATRLSGMVVSKGNEGKEVAKSTGYVLIQWNNGEKQWVASNRVRDLVVDSGRRQSKPTARFVPGKCEIEEKTDDHAWPPMSSKEWADIQEYYDYFAGSRQLLVEKGKVEDGPNSIREELDFHSMPHTIEEMIKKAKEKWHSIQVVKQMKKVIEVDRPMIRPAPAPVHPTIQLSLVFDAIRGDIPLMNVPELDEVFCVTNNPDRGSGYIPEIENQLEINEEQQWKMTSAKWEGKKAQCNVQKTWLQHKIPSSIWQGGHVLQTRGQEEEEMQGVW